MINIPGQLGWKQPNIGDTQGSIWSSFGIDVTSKGGTMLTSPRTMITTDNLTGMGVTSSFISFLYNGTQKYWAQSGKFAWNASIANGYITSFAKDATSGTPDGSTAASTMADEQSDMVAYGKDYLVISTTTDIFYLGKSAGSWLSIGGSPLDGATAHLLCVQPQSSKMYVTDLDVHVRRFDTGFTAPATSGTGYLDISAIGANKLNRITKLLPASDGGIWILGLNQTENGCMVVKWDGATTASGTIYEILDCSGILWGMMIGNTPWVLDNNGRLLYFNGGSFVPASNGKLPIPIKKFLYNSLYGLNGRWIHPNGGALVNGRINILINNLNNDFAASIEENLPSGIWEYDKDIGWYHKMSLSLYVQATGPITDYGQNRLSKVGALVVAKRGASGADTSAADGTLLAGGQYYSDASTARYGIWTDNSLDTIQKYGYFVTPKIFSAEISESWQKIYARHKKLLDSGDAIWIKYRLTETDPTEATITWTSTNTCTTTTDVSAFVGYEMEVIQGKGSGKCSTISSVVNNAGTYTITLSETFAGTSSGTAKARFQYWIEAGKNITQTVPYFEAGLFVNNTWIQFKICMQFTGKDQLNDLTVVSNPQILT